MAAFEMRKNDDRHDTRYETRLESKIEEKECNSVEGVSDTRRLKEECIVALKVYDSCRQQDCLTEREIGPARAAENGRIGDETFSDGDIITPPRNAASVTIDRLKVKKVVIVEKEPNPFKSGYWDIDLKYVFTYRLIFREADGCIIGTIRAASIYNKKVSLFGSIGTDLTISTDLFSNRHDKEATTFEADPFILVESKAVALDAKLKYQGLRNGIDEESARCNNEVVVTIGLFTIIKLFRIVNLTVESRGFCIPDECENIAPLQPCEFFDSLDFPMDIFAPPQKREFLAGVSSNIKRKRKEIE